MRLVDTVTQHFLQLGTDLGLDPAHLHVDEVYNPGGFTNASFRISDRRHTYHLKLASAPHRVDRLRRWYTLRDPLHERYRAPSILTWIDLPHTDDQSHHGLLFQHLPGRAPSFRRSTNLLGRVLALCAHLHQDADLASRLLPLLASHAASLPATHRESFIDTYIDRFRTDLEAVASNPPPFVPAGTLTWLREETEALAQAAATAAFDTPATAPIHGDLHEHNVLVAPDHHWHLLDWDDLILGDPALDYAMLLWPILHDHPPTAPWRAALPSSVVSLTPPPDPSLDERMALYIRAQSLDGVIDSLANYVDAAAAPTSHAHPDLLRTKIRRQHHTALRRYQSRLTPSPSAARVRLR